MHRPVTLVALVSLALLAACGGGGGSGGAGGGGGGDGGGGGGGGGTSTDTPPVLAAIADASVAETEALELKVSATDAEGDAIALSLTGAPEGMTLASTGGAGTITWTPAVGAAGSYSFTVTATAAGKSDSRTVRVAVRPRAAPFRPEVAAAGATTFLQFIPNEDPDGVQPLPGAANSWDLLSNFGIQDGFNDQWDGALTLQVTVGGEVVGFPSDQWYSELAFSTPAPAISPVGVTPRRHRLAGTASALLAGAAGARLSQPLDLTAATGGVTLAFVDERQITNGIPGWADSAYRVVLRSPEGALLQELVNSSYSSSMGAQTFDISSRAGSRVVLSFELDGGADCYAAVDGVSVRDAGREYVVNGDFETGDLTGWTAPEVRQSTNVTSGARRLGGLVVRRSFYTLPAQEWARMVDVFENPSDAAITATVVYRSELGSDGFGRVFPAADGRSVSSWDNARSDRDVAWVFGGGATFSQYAGGGLQAAFAITVPAHGKVALANFLVQSGVDTSRLTGTTAATHPAEVEAVAAAIVAGYATDPRYRDYLTAEQEAAIANF